MEIDFPEKIDGYELKDKLGDGSMGIVYLAERLGQKYAFKIFKNKTNSKKMMEIEYEISNIIAPLKPPHSKFSALRCPETIVCSLDKGSFLHEGKLLVVRHTIEKSFVALAAGHLEWGGRYKRMLV